MNPGVVSTAPGTPGQGVITRGISQPPARDCTRPRCTGRPHSAGSNSSRDTSRGSRRATAQANEPAPARLVQAWDVYPTRRAVRVPFDERCPVLPASCELILQFGSNLFISPLPLPNPPRTGAQQIGINVMRCAQGCRAQAPRAESLPLPLGHERNAAAARKTISCGFKQQRPGRSN